MLVVHLSRRPAHLPHYIGIALKSIGKHGSTVRRLRLQNWCEVMTTVFYKLMHPQPMQFCDKAQGPRQSFHNPLDSLSRQPLNYVHSWTSPTTIKRKKYQTCKHGLCLESSCCTCLSSSRAVKKGNCWRRFRLQTLASLKMVIPRQRAAVQHTTRQGENWKKASSSLYLDELLGWKL